MSFKGPVSSIMKDTVGKKPAKSGSGDCFHVNGDGSSELPLVLGYADKTDAVLLEDLSK